MFSVVSVDENADRYIVNLDELDEQPDQNMIIINDDTTL
jgi:hypothetical protein